MKSFNASNSRVPQLLLLTTLLASTPLIAADDITPISQSTASEKQKTQLELQRLNQEFAEMKKAHQQKVDGLNNRLEQLSAQEKTETKSVAGKANPATKTEVSDTKPTPVSSISASLTEAPTMENPYEPAPKPFIRPANLPTPAAKPTQPLATATPASVSTAQPTNNQPKDNQPASQSATATSTAPVVVANTQTAPTNTTPSELYLQALKAFSMGQTAETISLLNTYIKNYPNGALIAKAHYWLGEAQLRKEPANYAAARFEFLEVINRYGQHPNNDKHSKALYRLSQLSKINNYDDEVKRYATILQNQYPNSQETKLVKKLLQKQAK